VSGRRRLPIFPEATTKSKEKSEMKMKPLSGRARLNLIEHKQTVRGGIIMATWAT